MRISPEQEALIGRAFESYLTEHHEGDVLQLMAEPDVETHHAVVVNAMTLFEANMEVGDYFIAYPHDVLAIFDKALQRKAQSLVDEGSSKHNWRDGRKEQRMRCTLHARMTGLPVCPELTRVTIPRSRDVGHFLSVTGTVIRTSVAKVLEFEREYICTKCRHVFTVQADFDQYYTFVQPMGCPNPAGCNASKFTCLAGGSEPAACRDYQEIKIQEQVQRLSVGSVPRSVVVVLEDDLVDSCKSGDDVTVYGVMCLRWKPFYDGAQCLVEHVLKANNIEVNNQQGAAALLINDVQKEFEEYWSSYRHDPLAGRNQILLSLCPQVFGMYVIKLAVAMVLAGGVQRVDSSGTKIRGECHMLLVGDPGTGKSQFLKYAAKVVSRSVLTAGIGSTNAGLTVAAVRDGGDWHLEAGALVLADGGLCCIDEFNSIKENDRISIHEAMEQQSISVAKAGIVCKLNTRTTILAATNPKSQYNADEPLSVNVALASPLLSRFDLVLVLLDTKNEEWDRIISSFILEDKGLPAGSSGLWPLEKTKAYFSVIKGLQPKVSEEANRILARYYQLQRQSDCRNAARTTVRMLESLSRLAEAHARLMFRETVTIEDAVIALSVMECSMQGGGLLGNVNALLTSFPADPGQQYRTQCQLLLEGLGLPLLYQKEMDRLATLKRITAEASHRPLTDPSQRHLDDTDSNQNQGDVQLSKSKREELCGQTPADSPPRHRLLSQETRGSGDPTGARVNGTSSTEGQRNPTGSESRSAVVREEAQTPTDLSEKLSSFIFNPPKMRPLDHNRDAKKTATVTKETFSHHDSASTDVNEGKKRRNKLEHVSKGRSETGQSSSGARAHPQPPGRQKVVSPEVRCQEKARGNLDQETNSTVASPVQSTSNLASFRSGQAKPTVTASAVAKLSRFSFTSTPAPVRHAQAGEENSGHEKDRTVKETLGSPSYSPVRKKLRRTLQSHDGEQDLVTELESHTQTTATSKGKKTARELVSGVKTRVQQAPKVPVSLQSSVAIKKRKCFGLGPSSNDDAASESFFSGLSPLGSAAASHDVFDTDWDQEFIEKVA